MTMDNLHIEIFHKRIAVKTIEQDFADFTPQVQHFIAQYGLRQMLNDAASSQKAHESSDVIIAVEKKLETLRAGIIKSARSSDPFGQWVKGQLLAAIRGKGLSVKQATAYLAKCGNTYPAQVKALFKDNADKVMAAHKSQWQAIQADDIDLDIKL